MTKKAMLIVLVLVVQASMACGENGTQTHRINGTMVPDVKDVQETPKQEDACDCCQKCKAARRPTKPSPELEEDKTRKNGCDDCCMKCGRPVQPAPEEIPPEIIHKPRQK